MTNNTDALRIVAKFVGAANSARDVCEVGELCDAFIEEARAVLAAAPAVQPHCQCQPKECHGKGINECRWKIMCYSQSAQPEQEPVAWASVMNGAIMQITAQPEVAEGWIKACGDVQPLYASPQRAATGE